MFNLAVLKDTVAIHPSNFGIPPEQALIAELNKKYANRILHDVGLCISVFDLSEVGEGKVRYGDGFLWYKTVFRIIIFRPFKSEVILGKIKNSEDGSIRVTLGFFDDIYIPEEWLPQPCCFDPNQTEYFWIPDCELTMRHEMLETPIADRTYFEKGDVVRLRVEGDEFTDDEPGPPKAQDGVAIVPPPPRQAPYSIVASMAESGLGPVSWWLGAEDNAMEEN
ncbi:polymerase III polypeptide H [Rhodocollybia butyracea]|uniref:Polymerase III polypeptide H n=1 Tax=Rhodocollybia butyracea TaxID=206335 RepID=A0A9P5PVW4_9AGAR|nr:polymerase III polypeptide H [Rhodocollybia butyracea]